MTASLIIGALTAFGVASLTLPPLATLLRRRQIIDIPTARSSHVSPTPRGAGMSLVVATIAAGLALQITHGRDLGQSRMWSVLLVAPVCMGLLGAVEDWKRSLTVRVRLLAQMVASAGCGAWILVLANRSLVWLPVVAVAIISYVNMANFMDGIDGISGLHGVVCGSIYFAIGLNRHEASLQIASVILISGCLAFLPWNAPHARLFLGDAGSYFIGAMVVVLAITAMTDRVPIELAVAPMSIYLVDATWTIGHRAARGEPLTQPHRSHVYQRLALTTGHFPVAVIIAAYTIVVTILVGVGISRGGSWRATADTVAGFLLCSYLVLPRVRTLRRRHTAPTGRR